MRCKYLIVGLLLASVAGGCAGKKTNPFGSLASRFSKDSPKDPLALEEGDVSKGFAAANKGLRAPEETMLKFAEWKEDTGQYAEAKQRYREILTENEGCLKARLGIARIERETGRFDQCLDILMTANQQYPQNAEVLLELGRSHTKRQEMGKAIQYLKQAADAHPDEEQVRFELGVALARVGDYDDAVAHLRYAVGESAALFNVGFVLHQEGKSSEACTWIQNSLRTHPDDRTRAAAQELLARIDKNNNRKNREMPYPEAPMQRFAPTPGQTRVASLPTVQPSQFSPSTIAPQQPSGHLPSGQQAGNQPMPSLVRTTSAHQPVSSQVPIHTVAMPSNEQSLITTASQQWPVTAPTPHLPRQFAPVAQTGYATQTAPLQSGNSQQWAAQSQTVPTATSQALTAPGSPQHWNVPPQPTSIAQPVSASLPIRLSGRHNGVREDKIAAV